MAPTNRLSCLDGLRGLAVVLVILIHLSGPGMSCHPTIARFMWLFWFAPSGVRLFFVLSGFFLAHTMIRRSRAGRESHFGSYLFARWWRIGPPYYAALAICLAFPAVNLLIGRPDPLIAFLSVRQVAAHVFFVHGLGVDTLYGIDFVFWSMSLTFQFYLVFPLLYRLTERVGYPLMIAGVMASSLAFRYALVVHWPDYGYLVQGVFLGHWMEFASGMAIAFWYNQPVRGGSRWVSVPSLALLAAGLLGGAVAAVPYHSVPGIDFIYGGGYAVLLAAVLLSAECGGGLGRIFASAPLVRVGRLSYSLFLTHCVILEREFQAYRHLVARTTLATDMAMILIALVSVYVGGWLFYHVVEGRFVGSPEVPPGSKPTKIPDPCLADHPVPTPGDLTTELQPTSRPGGRGGDLTKGVRGIRLIQQQSARRLRSSRAEGP